MHNDIYYLIKSFLIDYKFSREFNYCDVVIPDEFIEKWSKEYVKKQQALDNLINE